MNCKDGLEGPSPHGQRHAGGLPGRQPRGRRRPARRTRAEPGSRYLSVVRSWRPNWEKTIPKFGFASEVRRLLYTTNAIESLRRGLRQGFSMFANKGWLTKEDEGGLDKPVLGVR